MIEFGPCWSENMQADMQGLRQLCLLDVFSDILVTFGSLDRAKIQKIIACLNCNKNNDDIFSKWRIKGQGTEDPSAILKKS